MSNTRAFMVNLQNRAQSLLTSALAENTSLTYRTALSSFNKFRKLYQLPNVWPTNIQQMIMFISYCYENGLLPSTISTYISGITYYHKLHGWLDFGNVFLIRKLLEGCRRSRGSKDKRAPITLSLLTDICYQLPSICYSSYEACLFQAVFTLAYFGLFRISELVSNSAISHANAVLKKDVVLESDGKIVVTLRVFKTNQMGQPVILKIPAESTSHICPVIAMQKYFQVRPSFEGPLFIHSNGSPLSRGQFSAVLSKCIYNCRAYNGLFRSHSFRIGRATQLALMGVSGDVIMKLGRWNSDAYLGYIRH